MAPGRQHPRLTDRLLSVRWYCDAPHRSTVDRIFITGPALACQWFCFATIPSLTEHSIPLATVPGAAIGLMTIFALVLGAERGKRRLSQIGEIAIFSTARIERELRSKTRRSFHASCPLSSGLVIQLFVVEPFERHAFELQRPEWNFFVFAGGRP